MGLSAGIKPNKGVSIAQAALTLALVIALVFFFVKAVIVFIAPHSVWVTPASSPLPIPSAQKAVQADHSFASDPFHRADAVQAYREDIGIDAPETTLNLTLVGRRAGAGGTAILVTPDRKQAVYAVGEEIINGVTLKAVNPDFIVLSLDGRMERLTFNKDGQTGLAAPIIPKPSKAIAVSIPASELIHNVRLSGVTRDGRLAGFKMTPTTDAINLQSIGIKPDDIITHLNGNDITAARVEIADVAKDFAATRSPTVTLIRGGNLMTLTLSQP